MRSTLAKLVLLGSAAIPILGSAQAGERRFESRWKPDEDGWIQLFNGKNLDGWAGSPTNWRVKDGQLQGLGSQGGAFLSAREAPWSDYCLALQVDAPGQLPTWTFTSFARGAVGVGVTGGQAAFQDVRVRILN